MCPSAPRVCSEPGGQRPVLSLSLDLIGCWANYVTSTFEFWVGDVLDGDWGNFRYPCPMDIYLVYKDSLVLCQRVLNSCSIFATGNSLLLTNTYIWVNWNTLVFVHAIELLLLFCEPKSWFLERQERIQGRMTGVSLTNIIYLRLWHG